MTPRRSTTPSPDGGLADPAMCAPVTVGGTPRHANALGVRASKPGHAGAVRMYLRVRAQYRDPARRRFDDLGPTPTSPWAYVGSARFKRREAGYTFSLNPPPSGVAYTLRARVDFEWRKRRGRRLVVVRRARAITTAGHRSGAGADPRRFSSAVCTLR